MSSFYPGTETCFTPLSSNGLNPNLFPLGTAQHLDINYNILPFLCDLLKATTDKNASPILSEPPPPFDITPFTDFTALTGIGDPRISLGEVMTQTYIQFLPRVITQSEVRQSGGTRVIDNYICTADGTPIKMSETVPVLLSLDLNGKKPYQYGAITVPPISSTFESLMQIIYAEEVKDFVSQYINSSKFRHAESFVDFINQYFSDYTAQSIEVYEKLFYFLVILKKGDNKIYIKYYSDVANKIGCLLALKTLNYHMGYAPSSNMAESTAGSSSIPNYKMLMEMPEEAQNWKKVILANYATTPQYEYTTMYSNITALSTIALPYFRDLDTRLTTTNIVSTVKVQPC
jgi:hypothetical protein